MTQSFQQLQRALRPDAAEDPAPGDPWDVLVIPSINLSPEQMTLVKGVHHYEERQLFELIRLRQPRARIVIADPFHQSCIPH